MISQTMMSLSRGGGNAFSVAMVTLSPVWAAVASLLDEGVKFFCRTLPARRVGVDGVSSLEVPEVLDDFNDFDFDFDLDF